MRKFVRKFFLILSAVVVICLGGVVAGLMYFATTKVPLKQYFPTEYTNAVWDWSNPLNKTSGDLQTQADFMYLHQLNAVYVDVGAYASTIDEKDAYKKASDTSLLQSALRRYVDAMKAHNISVYAAAGDVSWSDRDKQYIPLAILDFVQQYNQTYTSDKLAGVEFDIESYNQKDFSTGSDTVKSLVLTDYVSMVNRLVAANLSYNHGKDLELGLALPYWFDNENGNIPSITWKDKTGPTLYHVLDGLNSLPKSNIVVMAYRNAARGNDGVISHSRTEVDYANAKAQNVKVIIGQEVNDVEPAKITYFNQSAEELSGQYRYVVDEFKSKSQFGGIAINDLAGYKNLTGVN